MFDILSIIFIIIIAISAIIGFKKGLVSTLIGFAKGVVSIIVGCLLAKPVGTILNNSSLGEGEVENPQTGSTVNWIALSIFLVLTIALLWIIRKKNVFHRL